MDIKRTLDLMVNSVKNTIGAKAFIHAIARNWEGVALRQEIMPLLDPKEEQIISAAMILAGLEKGEGDLAEAQDSFPLMDCVFDRLDWDSADSPHFYPPINLDHKHDNVTPYPETEFAQDKRDNSQHWGFFFERFEKLRHPDMPELISLAETYLSYIPVVAKRNQDISVFDFAKMTAAYSECIQKSDPDKRDLPFILFGADFSGVQKFIYSITSKGALKTLRARSFYLELLVEHAVYEILTGFGLSHANVIISGGGRFTLILPNSEKLLDLVKKVISTMNAFLLKHLEGKLYIVHGTVELSRGDIKNIWTKWRELGGEIAKNKRQKFSDLFESRQGCCFNDLFKPQLFDEDSSLDLKISEFDSERECGYCNSSGGKKLKAEIQGDTIFGCESCLSPSSDHAKRRECSVCHKYSWLVSFPEPAKGTFACPFCANLYHLGEHLPFSRYVARKKLAPEEYLQNKGAVQIGDYYYKLIQEDKIPDEDFEAVWVFNRFDLPSSNDLKFPLFKFLFGNYPSYSDEKKIEVPPGEDKKKIRELETLARCSTGDAKIAVLRADVDNLGNILHMLPERDRTLVRFSVLSRELAAFFKFHLNSFLRGENIPEGQTSILRQNSERPIARHAVIVYSGGDDLFITGAWNDISCFAFDIQKAFKKFTCGKLTLSGGFVLTTPSYPLYQLAELAEQAEKKAKDNQDGGKGKNALAPFYSQSSRVIKESFKWRDAEEILKLIRLFNEAFYVKTQNDIVEYSAPTAFFYQLLKICETYKTKGKLYLPKLAYTFAMKDLKPVHDYKLEVLKEKILNDKEIMNYLQPALTWIILSQRRQI